MVGHTQSTSDATQSVVGTLATPESGPITIGNDGRVALPPPTQLRAGGPTLGPLQVSVPAESHAVFGDVVYTATEDDGLLPFSAVAGGMVVGAERTESISRRQLLAGTAALVGANAMAETASAEETTALELDIQANPGLEIRLIPGVSDILDDDATAKLEIRGDEVADVVAGESDTVPRGVTGRARLITEDSGLLPDVDLPDPDSRYEAIMNRIRERLENIKEEIDFDDE